VNGRRLAIGAVAALVAAAALVALGRWERDRRAEEQVRGMASVVRLVGPLDSPQLSAFRYLKNFQCLLYRRGKNRVALELCADPAGRVVEAFDRRGADPRIWSLRDDPKKSTLRIDRHVFDRALMRMGVPQDLVDAAHAEGGS
jgi:hypothetical protein